MSLPRWLGIAREPVHCAVAERNCQQRRWPPGPPVLQFVTNRVEATGQHGSVGYIAAWAAKPPLDRLLQGPKRRRAGVLGSNCRGDGVQSRRLKRFVSSY